MNAAAAAYREWMLTANDGFASPEDAERYEQLGRQVNRMMTADWCAYQAIHCKGCSICPPRDEPIQILGPDSWWTEHPGLTPEEFWTELLKRRWYPGMDEMRRIWSRRKGT